MINNKAYEFGFELINIKEHETYLDEYRNKIKKFSVVGKDKQECLERFKQTLKANWGNRQFKLLEDGKEVKINNCIKNVDFDKINKNGICYYNVYENDRLIKGFNDLKEAINLMNRCGKNAWIFDKNDIPYNTCFVYGDEI